MRQAEIEEEDQQRQRQHEEDELYKENDDEEEVEEDNEDEDEEDCGEETELERYLRDVGQGLAANRAKTAPLKAAKHAEQFKLTPGFS